MKATKEEWLTRQKVIDRLDYSRLSDPLLAALWDAVEQIKPIQHAIQNTRRSLAEKYALLEDGEVQTKEGLVRDLQDDQEGGEQSPEVEVLIDDYLQVQTRQRGTILVEQEGEFREAMQEALQEVVELEVETVSLSTALDSQASMGELQETVGWIIEQKPTTDQLPLNGRNEQA